MVESDYKRTQSQNSSISPGDSIRLGSPLILKSLVRVTDSILGLYRLISLQYERFDHLVPRREPCNSQVSYLAGSFESLVEEITSVRSIRNLLASRLRCAIIVQPGLKIAKKGLVNSCLDTQDYNPRVCHLYRLSQGGSKRY